MVVTGFGLIVRVRTRVFAGRTVVLVVVSVVVVVVKLVVVESGVLVTVTCSEKIDQ